MPLERRDTSCIAQESTRYKPERHPNDKEPNATIYMMEHSDLVADFKAMEQDLDMIQTLYLILKRPDLHFQLIYYEKSFLK